MGRDTAGQPFVQYSKVTMPPCVKPYPSIIDFLAARFPHVTREVWERRLGAGKLLDEKGDRISPETGYQPGKSIFYFREVATEPVIPFAERIVFQSDELVVACKPHFLPVNPTGPYVAECLVNRLKTLTGNHDLVPVNRIDRETAGLVLLSANRKTRSLYYELFRNCQVEKEYQAVALYPERRAEDWWIVENRMVPGEPWFRMTTAPGEPNSRSVIRLEEARGERALFTLKPLTGKTHQLRLHMAGLGFGIVNDRYYPTLQPQSADDFEKPLQLLARKVAFRDPVTGERMEFFSERKLVW